MVRPRKRKCTLSVAAPHHLNQNLRFHKCPGWVFCTLKFEKHWHVGSLFIGLRDPQYLPELPVSWPALPPCFLYAAIYTAFCRLILPFLFIVVVSHYVRLPLCLLSLAGRVLWDLAAPTPLASAVITPSMTTASWPCMSYADSGLCALLF